MHQRAELEDVEIKCVDVGVGSKRLESRRCGV
jgi:hypothetical protein